MTEIVATAHTRQVRFYIGSARAVAERRLPQIGPFGVSGENATGKMCQRKSPGTVTAVRGATQEVETPMHFQRNDGGREAAGFKGDAGDCVTRAIAIALELPYRQVYDDLAARMEAIGKAKSSRNGITRKVYEDYLGDQGWRWYPTMHIGAGCTIHMKADELPPGRLIARLSRHMCAVVDGTAHDTHDPSRGGTRCVYGYFKKDWAH